MHTYTHTHIYIYILDIYIYIYIYIVYIHAYIAYLRSAFQASTSGPTGTVRRRRPPGRRECHAVSMAARSPSGSNLSPYLRA